MLKNDGEVVLYRKYPRLLLRSRSEAHPHYRQKATEVKQLAELIEKKKVKLSLFTFVPKNWETDVWRGYMETWEPFCLEIYEPRKVFLFFLQWNLSKIGVTGQFCFFEVCLTGQLKNLEIV